MFIYLILAAIAVFIFERVLDILNAKEGFDNTISGYVPYNDSSILEQKNANDIKTLQKRFDNMDDSDKTSIRSLFLKAAKLISDNTSQINKIKKEIKEAEKPQSQAVTNALDFAPSDSGEETY